MVSIYRIIESSGIISVVCLNSEDQAIPLAKALVRGGMPCIEITFRTSCAEAAIRMISSACPEAVVGAGTILTVAQAEAAKNAGAKFIVSPGFNVEIVKYCTENGLPVFPGVVTPSEIMQALQFGLITLKFFPAEASGGIAMLKSLSGPFPNVKFIPTGGIHEKNISEYLELTNVSACGGTWMASASLIASGAFDKITQIARSAIFSSIGFQSIKGDISFLTSTESKFEKGVKLEKGGSIEVSVLSVERACTFLIPSGFKMLENTACYGNNNLKSIDLQEKISGFIIHLLRR